MAATTWPIPPVRANISWWSVMPDLSLGEHDPFAPMLAPVDHDPFAAEPGALTADPATGITYPTSQPNAANPITAAVGRFVSNMFTPPSEVRNAAGDVVFPTNELERAI